MDTKKNIKRYKLKGKLVSSDLMFSFSTFLEVFNLYCWFFFINQLVHIATSKWLVFTIFNSNLGIGFPLNIANNLVFINSFTFF